MSIFSLQTKKHLVGWGLVAGILLDIAVKYIYSVLTFQLFEPWRESCHTQYLTFSKKVNGWPFNGVSCDANFWTIEVKDLFFWILIGLIILFLVRYFKYRR